MELLESDDSKKHKILKIYYERDKKHSGNPVLHDGEINSEKLDERILSLLIADQDLERINTIGNFGKNRWTSLTKITEQGKISYLGRKYKREATKFRRENIKFYIAIILFLLALFAGLKTIKETYKTNKMHIEKSK